jgi:hypothetical protein
VLELVDPYVPGQEHVVLRVRRLDESLHLASDDGVTANVRVFDVVTRHRRVVVNDGRFVGYVCAGAAISHDMGVETDLSAGGRPANDPKRYTSIADLNAKQLEAVLYPRPHPVVLLKFLKEWNELAADCPGVMESAKLTGAKGALARNACSVLHLPKKKQLFHRILLRAVMVGRNVRDFAPERDRCAGCKLESETLEHMLWECPLVHKVWIHALNTLDRLRGAQRAEWCDSRNAFSLSAGSCL